MAADFYSERQPKRIKNAQPDITDWSGSTKTSFGAAADASLTPTISFNVIGGYVEDGSPRGIRPKR